MAKLDTRRTYLSFNNKDIIRDGVIPLRIFKEYDPPSSFNLNRANNPPKGVTYDIEKDEDGNVTSVIESKKLLPAEKIKIEIDFSKVMKSANQPLIEPGGLGFSPLVNMVAGPILSPIGTGGITSGESEITYHILDSETRINESVTVTEEMIETGIYESSGYPLSVFAIVKEHIKKETNEDGEEKEISVGLEFTSETQLENLGRFDNGTRDSVVGLDFTDEGQIDSLSKFNERKRIDGSTNSDGLFGGKGNPYLVIVNSPGDSGLTNWVER